MDCALTLRPLRRYRVPDYGLQSFSIHQRVQPPILLTTLKHNTTCTSLIASFHCLASWQMLRTEEKHPKLYLWQGVADAIAYSWNLNKYVVVDFKVVDNLLYYWQSKSDLCGKHLHQCLVYAKLLQMHMGLDYLPPSLIVAIDRITGNEGYFPLFQDYPDECKEKLDEYEWFTKQPPKRPLRIGNTEKLLHEDYKGKKQAIAPDTPLQEIFQKEAKVKDLLDALGYDSLEIVEQHRQLVDTISDCFSSVHL